MKCEQYWPNKATSSTYADITVTSLKEDFYAEFVVRTLSLARVRYQFNGVSVSEYTFTGMVMYTF